jgi:hypothetical protein
MPVPNAAKPATAETVNGLRGNDHAGQRDEFSNSKPSPKEQARLLAELAAARRHLEYRGEANRVIAQWRDELRRRIQRADLEAELIGLDEVEHQALRDEVRRYKRLCAALGWSPSGRGRP